MLTRSEINEAILNTIVSDWKASQRLADMIESDAYYNSENTGIMSRKRVVAFADEVPGEPDDNGLPTTHTNIYTKEDLRKANHKLPHGFHFELVNQVKNLLVGEPVRISWKTDDDGAPVHANVDGLDDAETGITGHAIITDDIKQVIDDILFVHNDWGTFNQENVKNNQKYAEAWMRVTINPKTGFPLMLNINSKEIIDFEDEFGDLTCVIRVYTVEKYDDKGKKYEVDYAEVYDDEYKDVYSRTRKNGKFKLDIADVPLLQTTTAFDDGSGNVIEGETTSLSWGRIPFVKWKFNDEKLTALKPIKPFIDLMDIELSDLGNDIEDWREAIWVLENYHGQSVSDFLNDLNTKHVIKVGDGGNARPERNEIPYDARLKMYEVLEKNVYRYGRGINFGDRNNLGNISGVGLKWSYELLEEKANEIEVYGQTALNGLFKLIFRYLTVAQITAEDLDVNDLEFIFRRSLLINEKDDVETLVKASAFLSDKTILEHLPMVDDAEDEMKRLEEEGKDNFNEAENEALAADAIRQLELEEDKKVSDKGNDKTSAKYYGQD